MVFIKNSAGCARSEIGYANFLIGRARIEKGYANYSESRMMRITRIAQMRGHKAIKKKICIKKFSESRMMRITRIAQMSRIMKIIPKFD
jgi:hypothetical protein